MIRWLLRKFGYLKVDYGCSCGRYWLEIDGKIIAQTEGDAVWMRDADVKDLTRAILPSWKEPAFRLPDGFVGVRPRFTSDAGAKYE